MAIDPLAATRRSGPAAHHPRPRADGFRVPDQPRAAAAPPAAEVGLAGMLALQEIDRPDRRDREAHARGQDLLAELAALQRALLVPGEVPAATLHRLAGLARDVPLAADPRLRVAVAAIALRARVELARHQRDNSSAVSPPVR